MWITLSVFIFVVGLLCIQSAHYKFQESQKDRSEVELDDAHYKEFQEYKNRVDALSLRAGFKL